MILMVDRPSASMDMHEEAWLPLTNMAAALTHTVAPTATAVASLCVRISMVRKTLENSFTSCPAPPPSRCEPITAQGHGGGGGSRRSFVSEATPSGRLGDSINRSIAKLNQEARREHRSPLCHFGHLQSMPV